MIYNGQRNFPFAKILKQEIWIWYASDIRVGAIVCDPTESTNWTNNSQFAEFDDSFYMPGARSERILC